MANIGKVKTLILRVKIVILLLFFALQVGSSHAEPKITFASYGGTYQQKIVESLFAPAAKELNLTVLNETHKGIASVRVQVESGSPTWDIVQLGSEECAIGEKLGLFENLDSSIMDFEGIPKSARGKAWVGSNFYSIVLAWQKDKYPNKPPTSWKDFWDVENFPGTRSLPAFASGTIEAALMADGVRRDKLYPIDVKRGIGTIKRIAPHITVWWTSGAQSAQLLRDGEVDMIMTWGSRVAAALADGANIDFTYHDGILGVGCFAIPKGAPNAQLAQQMVSLMISPNIQANIPEVLQYYGPVNLKAFEVKAFSKDALEKSNSSPENAAKQIIFDADWWRDNQLKLKVDERYKEVVVAN